MLALQRLHALFDLVLKKSDNSPWIRKALPRIFFLMNINDELVDFYPINSDVFQHHLSKELIAAKIKPVKIDVTTIKPKVVDLTFKCDGTYCWYGRTKIHAKQYKSMKARYVGDADNMNLEITKVVYLYKTILGTNIGMAVPPCLHDLGITFELFGSPLNTKGDYCSPFISLEANFGSNGSFFNYQLSEKHVYLAAPPYDEDLMEQMALRLEQAYSQNPKLTFVVVIPVWDSESQKENGYQDYGMNFACFTILKNICSKRVVLPKHQGLFYDYYTDSYVPICNNHVMLIGKWVNWNKFITEWKQITANTKN